jgi:hypothetical protein
MSEGTWEGGNEGRLVSVLSTAQLWTTLDFCFKFLCLAFRLGDGLSAMLQLN